MEPTTRNYPVASKDEGSNLLLTGYASSTPSYQPAAIPHDPSQVDAVGLYAGQLRSLLLISAVLTGPYYMLMQIPNIASNPLLRTFGFAAGIWDVTGCLSALVLLTSLHLQRVRSPRCAQRFAERILSMRSGAMGLASPYAMIGSSAILYLTVIIGFIWIPFTMVPKEKVVMILSPIEWTLLGTATLIAVIHLGFVSRTILRSYRCDLDPLSLSDGPSMEYSAEKM